MSLTGWGCGESMVVLSPKSPSPALSYPSQGWAGHILFTFIYLFIHSFTNLEEGKRNIFYLLAQFPIAAVARAVLGWEKRSNQETQGCLCGKQCQTVAEHMNPPCASRHWTVNGARN